MLSLAKLLLLKVDNPGEGKGFVSSSHSPEQLADQLFEAFFTTFHRIVTLKDYDITGLDALQALALSGQEATFDEEHEGDKELRKSMTFRDQIIKVPSGPRTSKYNLITKKVNITKASPKRRGIELAKKLSKKRRLVIQKRRSGKNKKSMKSKLRRGHGKRHRQSRHKSNRQGTKRRRLAKNRKGKRTEGRQANRACHWRYECRNPLDLETCQLFTECKNSSRKQNNTPAPQDKVQISKLTQDFRKALGISEVDEQVEKILGTRIAHLKPQNMESGERIESLAEYFNNVILAQEKGSTTAMPPSFNDVGNLNKNSVEVVVETVSEINDEIKENKDKGSAEDENDGAKDSLPVGFSAENEEISKEVPTSNQETFGDKDRESSQEDLEDPTSKEDHIEDDASDKDQPVKRKL
ncbi:uncharacterized protein LOC126968940 isoform X2 [Leptidea sinapis]|uniref:uncharacterized protein LOC126968940 isoform X2 n=1 Tax=Leptidea sinapis TaxID=189913 RepID=UPI0021C290D5|nr:uncharacterized protein LOC126968940 isoform X2 [Leptidea sinapis]